jgi:hypothetical protein
MLTLVNQYWDGNGWKALTTDHIGKSVTLFRRTSQNADAFWMTYGTETPPKRMAQAVKPQIFSTASAPDRGETFGNVSMDYLKEDVNEEYPFEKWDWMAKTEEGSRLNRLSPDQVSAGWIRFLCKFGTSHLRKAAMRSSAGFFVKPKWGYRQ